MNIKVKLSFIFLTILFNTSFIDLCGQAVGIGLTLFTPDASSMLEVRASNKGLLIPRLSLTSFTDNTTIPNPATSLLLYNQGSNIPVGYYYNAGTPAAPQWVRLLDQRSAWLLTGNLGTDPATNFLGTTDAQPLIIRTNNLEQIRILSTGQVGIGLTVPTQRLVVAGNIGLQSGGNAFVGTLDNFALSLRTNNTERFFISNTGNVGIGTTSPATQLHTTGTVRFANYASGASGAVLRTNSLGDLAITNFTGSSSDVLTGNGTFVSLSSAIGTTAWLLTGNSGTTSSNFLGTSDNQHLAIRTNNTERMRFQNNGQIVVNATTAFGSYLFDIEGNTTFANPLYVGTPVATGTGIVVQNYASAGSSNGSALLASSNQTGWPTAGFLLRNSTVYSNTAVSAVTDATITDGRGIIGQCNNTSGIGVLGLNLSTTGNPNASGVWGQTSNPQGSGIAGINTSTTSNIEAKGVFGQTSNPAGDGGYFVNVATTGTNYGNGVYSATSQRMAAGVYGVNLNTLGTGIIGKGNNASVGILAAGSGGAFTGTNFGVYGNAANTGNDTWGGYFSTANIDSYVYVGGRYNNTNYKINGQGSVSTIVERPNGSKANMFCPEAPEILFMDVGRGQLINGRATIVFDPTFAHNIHVDEKHPLNVFIQLEGDCNGVFVSNKTQYGFEVVELQGGKSNVPFTWQAIAVRADSKDDQGNITSKHVGVRFPDAPEPLKVIALDNQKSHKIASKSIEHPKQISIDTKEIKLRTIQ